MARFPDLYPAGRAAGPFPPQPPFPPGTGPGIGTVSFTRRPVSGSATIDALMRRQRDMAERQAALATQAYPGMGTITGGLGNMVNQFTAGLAEHRAREEEAAGRAELAQALSGIDQSTGIATPEQLATIYSRDPDTGLALMQNAIETRRAQRAAELAATQRIEERGWSVEDREDAQRAAAELAASRIEQWEDIETPEGAPAGQRFQRNKTTGEVKAVGGGGVSVQLMSPETAARIGLGDEFLTNYETVLSSAKAGEMTGPADFTNAVMFGRGPGGEAYRMLKQGSEALVRQMTGAGMSQGEARERAAQYEPQWTDDADVLASKVEGLKNALEATRAGATFGRTAPPAPETAAPQPDALPPGITEEDIQFTLKNHPELTREQLLERLRQNAP